MGYKSSRLHILPLFTLVNPENHPSCFQHLCQAKGAPNTWGRPLTRGYPESGHLGPSPTLHDGVG